MAKDFIIGIAKGALLGALAIIVLVPLVLFGITPIVRSIGAWLSTPSHVASTHIASLDATVRIELVNISPISKAEYEQTLVVQTPAGLLRHKLITNWGGAYHFSLYLTEDGRLAIIGPIATLDIISLAPLGVQSGYPYSLNSNAWTYLGAFSQGAGRGFSYRFYPADSMKECIALLGDNPSDIRHGYRRHAYRRSCTARWPS